MNEGHEKLEAIFAAAVELSGKERTDYLDRACAGEAELRRQVERLLCSLQRAGGFLTQGAKVPAADRAATIVLPATPLTEKAGDTIDRYKLLEPLGEGGFGAVYMAEQRVPVKRRVALKIIKLGMDTKEVVARFEAERQALALMEHPNIARVLDAGTTQTGRPYFVMELVRGIRITDYCDQNQLKLQERLRLFLQVCHAVQHAHQKGVIHRDIKPSNILVTLHDGVPVPKVIDFGIAKATQQELTERTLFTQFHQFLGTPAYMSPEQAELSGLDIDTRSDIYSLGVLLYELLVGQPPFDGRELLKAGLDEMRRTLREVEPARPSTRLSTMAADVRTTTANHRQTEAPRLIHLLRGDLDWIVMKALEKHRTRRYETANGLAADIQRHLSNEPVAARPPSATYRFQKMVRRNKTAVAAAGAVVAALVIGLGVSTWLFMKERTARARAQAQQQRAEGAEQQAAKETAIAKAVNDFLRRDLLETADSDIQVGMGMPANPNLTVLEALDRASDRIEERFREQPLVEAAIRLTIGKTYSGLGDYRRALPHLERSLELRRTHLGSAHDDTVSSMRSLAENYRRMKRAPEAVRLWEEIAKINSLQPPAKSNSPSAGRILNDMSGLGISLVDTKRATEAIVVLEELLKQCQATSGWASTPKAMYYLARAYSGAGNTDKALSVGQEALRLQLAERGPEDRNIADMMEFVAALFFNSLGQKGKALPLQEEVLKLRRTQLGAEHPSTLLAMDNLGMTYRELRRTNEAAALLREAAALKRKVEEQRPGRSALGLTRLGDHFFATHQYAEADRFYADAVALARKEATENPESLRTCLGNYAPFLKHQKRWAEAEPVYREVLQLHRATRPPTHEDVVYRNLALARFLAEWALDESTNSVPLPSGATGSSTERVREAERLLRDCLATRLQTLKPDSHRLADTRSCLGGALVAAAVVDSTLSRDARLAKLMEAESLLLPAHEELLKHKGIDPKYQQTSFERLIHLYAVLENPDEAAQWRRNLEAFTQKRAEQKAADIKEASQ